MKIAIVLLAIGTVVAANPMMGFGAFGGFGAPNSQFYLSLLHRDLQILISPPDFPVDLAQKAIDVVANAETGFSNCDSGAYPLPYLQRICIVQTYAAARNALNAISQEAEARAQSNAAGQNNEAGEAVV